MQKPKLTDERLEEFKLCLTEFPQSVDEDLQNNDLESDEIEELKALKQISIELKEKLNNYKKLSQIELIELGMDLMAFTGIIGALADEDFDDEDDEFIDDDELEFDYEFDDEDEDEDEYDDEESNDRPSPKKIT
jgi:hypothetical protein